MTPEVARCLRRARLDPLTASVRALSGGITNRNYRVDAAGRSYVLRLGGKHAAELGIDRRREAACARIAARLGLGAEIVAFLPSQGALLSRYLPGRPLSRAEARRPRTLLQVARALRRLHAGPAFPGRFCAFATVERYTELARRRGLFLPLGLDEARRRLARIKEAAGQRPARPCHNDLLAGNLILAGPRLSLIDWEYAGMGDPFFDLGNYAANQELGPDAASAFLRAYTGRERPQDQARLELMRLASDLREACWGFLQAGVSELAFDFKGYGKKYLERFLRRSSGPRFFRLLAAVEGAGS